MIPKAEFQRLKPVRILLLEDEPSCTDLVRRYLVGSGSQGISLRCASTLAEALAELRGNEFDLVLCDLNVPDSSGLATLESLVAATDRLIIVLTAIDEPALAEAAIERGAYEFLHKKNLSAATLKRLVRLAILQAGSMERAREREARLKAIVDTEPECVKVIDAEGRLVEMNAAGLRMIEADALDPLRGQCISGLVVEEHRDAFLRMTQRVAAGSREEVLEFDIVGLKGTRRQLETRAVPLRDEAGGRTLVLAVTRDVSEQKRAVQARQKSEERFRGLTELSSDWYWEQDIENRITFMSSSFAERTGLDATAYLGRRRWDEPAPNLTEADWERHRAQLARREPFRNLEIQRAVGPGRGVWVSLSGEPVFDDEGSYKGYRGVGRDITAQKRAEQRLRMEHAVTRALAEAETPEAGLVAALEALCETGGWECGRYFGLDEAGAAMRLEHAWHVPSAEIGQFIEKTRRLRFGPGAGLIGRVWQSGEPLWAPDLHSDPRVLDSTTFEKYPLLRSDFEFPVATEGRVLGAISLASREPREPDEGLMQTVRVVGNQIGQFVARKSAETTIRDSEARFRSLVELSSDMYWEQDAEYRFTVLSGKAPQWLEQRRSRLVGQHRWDNDFFNMGEADWARHKADLDARRVFHDLELGRINEEGDIVWVSVSGEPFFGPDGTFKGYRGIGKDITLRKREERLLALEHAVTRRLAEAGSVSEALRGVLQAICESENWHNGRYFSLDEARGVMRFAEGWHAAGGPLAQFAETSRGRTFALGEGLIGHVWRSGEPLWVPDVQSDPRVAFSARVQQAGVHSALLVPVAFEGRVSGVLSMSSRTIRKPEERLLGALRVIGSQIGQFLQRKQVESALHDSEARFRQTYELAAAGIAHVALDGRYLRVNRKLCEILGYAESELTARSVKDISHPDDRDVTDDDRARLIAGEVASVRKEKRYLRKDGSVVWVNVNIALLRDSKGAPQYEIAVYEDITERRQAESELRRFRTALDSSADMMFLVNTLDARLLDFNDAACRYLGYERAALLGRPAADILVVPSTEVLRDSYANLVASGERSDSLVRTYRRKDGSTFEAEVLRRLIDSPDGPILVINSRDLTERRLAEQRQATHLRYQERIARFGESALAKREAADLVDEAIGAVRESLAGGIAAYVEPGAGPCEVALRGLAGARISTQALTARYAPGDDLARVLERAEPATQSARGTRAAVPFAWAEKQQSALLIPVLGEAGARGALCVLSESPNAFGIEESRFVIAVATVLSAALQRIESEGRLAFLAQFDGLTGLPNRALLSDRFSQMIVQARRHGTSLGVLFIDLDDFKLVNDTLGHPAGDELLREAARRLMASIRTGDTVARVAGDEFAIVLADLARADDAALVAQKVIERLAEPVQVRSQEVFVTASIGIATFPADGSDAESLLGAADAAMYRAKQSGRNAYQFFTSEINLRTRARAQMGTELRRALEREEFALVYQPKFELLGRRPCAAEALLRWNHPERGVVSPAEFIPVLEESGLIVQVGEWVLRRACADLKDWKRAGLKPIPIAVNLSARQFRQQDLDTRIHKLVADAGVDPALIELEITESQLMQDPDHAIRVMRSLAEAGIRIAIDDFGTGYSSLSYLSRFPVSSLKIDRSFVAEVLTDEAAAAIVRAIIDMAHTLGFTVVAEGVETDAQAAFLRGMSCEQAQGYLFARPMPAAEFKAMIAPAGGGPRKRRAAARES